MNMDSDQRQPSLFRTLVGWGAGIPVTLFIAFIAIAGSAITRDGDIVHRCARFWGKTILRLCKVKVSVTGESYLTGNAGPFLIVANHQSMFDIFALSGFLPIRFAWIAKNSLFRIPLVGTAMLRAGHIPVNRQNSESARQSIKRAAASIEKHSIVIFPEGTRSRSGVIGRFKKGASHLAACSGAPIVPVTITGSWKRLPPKHHVVAPGTITLHIDAPVQTAEKNREDIDHALSGIRDLMIERVKNL